MIDDILEDLEPYTWSEQEKFMEFKRRMRNVFPCGTQFDVENSGYEGIVYACYAPRGHKGQHYWLALDVIYHGKAHD